MTSTLPDVQPNTTPAQQAMAVALAYAVAAQHGVEQRVQAWLAGRISRVDLCYAAAQQILQAVAKATLAAEHFSEVEWQVRVQPRVIPAVEHERLVQAMDTITKDAQKVQAADLAKALTTKPTVTVEPDVAVKPDVVDTPAEPKPVPEVVMRSTRLAKAEVITAGRTGYAAATAQAVGDDPEFVWRFVTDADPCGRCVALATKTFQSFEAAPDNGSHPGCLCVLTAEYRED